MPSRLQESLKEKVAVTLRSSNDLTSKKVQLYLADKINEVTLKNERVLLFSRVAEEHEDHKKKKGEAENEKQAHELTITISEIIEVKPKNFVEKLIQVWVLSITCTAKETDGEAVQHFLEFEHIEKRDDWGNGLRSLHHAHTWANKPMDTRKDLRKLHLIKKITLVKPRQVGRLNCNSIVSMDIELGNGDTVPLDIPEKKFDSETCKEITNDCVFQNSIVPAEGASMYRYVRSVISRVQMEKETNAIISEIDTQKYAEVTKGHQISLANASTIRTLLHTAESNLKELAKNVPGRIGKHGPSSQLIVDILLRSIEKTQVYNKFAYTCNFNADLDANDDR